jgi:hypothetical protein
VLESCLQATQKFGLFCLNYYFKIFKMLFKIKYLPHLIKLPESNFPIKFGSATNVMLFFRSKGVATPLLRKNRKKKTLNLQHYLKYYATDIKQLFNYRTYTKLIVLKNY